MQDELLEGLTLPPRDTQRVFSRDEIDRHRSRESCWLTAHGKVYDVTPWLDRHPAGSRCLLTHAGSTDSGRDYDFHSPEGRKLWAVFQIGRVEGHQESSQCVIL